MVCDENTTANGTAMEGLSRCVLKGTRMVLRGGRGSDAPNLPDVTKVVYHIQSKNRRKYPMVVGWFFSKRDKLNACPTIFEFLYGELLFSYILS
jgi:hypothetical protein